MERRVFAVWRTGTRWDHARGTREQDLWDAHVAFIDSLYESGLIVMAGPLADDSGAALLVVECGSLAEAEHLFDADPWTVEDVLRVTSVKEWTLFLDARTRT